MEYAQLNESGTEALQVSTHGNVAWDANNFCSADALTRDGKADQFRVVPLTVTEPPSYDPLTQSVIRDGCELVDGAWQYKWRIDALSAEQIEAKRLASIPQVVTMRQARLGLLSAGLLSTVQTAIAGAGPAAVIEWDYATEVQRASGLVPAMATALGLTDAQIDALFVQAATL